MYDPQSITPDDVDNLFISPTGSKLTIEKEKDLEKICCEELSDILKDCFLEDDKKDTGKKIEEFYKDGVLEGLVPKNKKTLRKYKNYQNDYMDCCSDLTMNTSW